MGKTMFEKIVAKHLVRQFADGEMALKLDRVWCHEITTPNAILDMKKRGIDVVFDPNKIKTMIDHVIPAKDTASAIQGKIIREWSREHRIEFLDVGNRASGVCHAAIPQNGWISPGDIGIMGDSHTCTHGAFGALTAGVGTTEMQNGIVNGLWVCPPQRVIRVNFNGTLPANVFAKDLILKLISFTGVEGATNAVLEFGGPVISEMNMEGRMTIANMAVEAGATSGMMMIDDKTIRYLWPALSKVDSPHKPINEMFELNSDSDAEYYRTIDIDVGDLVPVITEGYSPGQVAGVLQLSGKKVDQVYIGSCTNGRMSDLRIAAAVINKAGGRISENVRCVIVPATQHIFEQAIKEGLVKIFLEAGCYVNGPTCGACLGMSCGVIAPEEVCVSTTNRNFRGRMGKGGMVHLTSPATAAITAVKGVITEPDHNFCAKVASDIFLLDDEVAHPTDWNNETTFEKPDYAKLRETIVSEEARDFSGTAFYHNADNVDTDQIIPAKYLNETDKQKFGAHCLEDAAIPDAERPKLYQSQILVAGENFGCGSSREHAPWALAAAGIRCVIASSFARIFENNMFATGLLCVTVPKQIIADLMRAKSERITVDFEKGVISWFEKAGLKGCEIPCPGSYQFEVSNYHKQLIRNGDSVGFMIGLAAELAREEKK